MTGGGNAVDPYLLNESWFDTNGDGKNEYELGYNAYVRNNARFKTIVNPNNITGTKGVFIIAGESIASNSIAIGPGYPAHYTLTQPNLYMLDIYDGGIYVVSDPMVGTTQGAVTPPMTACPMTILADFIQGIGWYQNTIMFNISVGGSSSYQWQHPTPGASLLNNGVGIFNNRFSIAKRRLDAFGLTPTAILWQQGYNDTSPGVNAAAYQIRIQEVVDTIRTDLHATCPLFIALQALNPGRVPTLPSDAANIRNAQQNIINGNANCYQGADTDNISVTNRWDGLHLDSNGAALWALDWRNKMDIVLP